MTATQVRLTAASLLLSQDYITIPEPLAVALGLDRSVLLKAIDNWCKSNATTGKTFFFREDNWWTKGSYEDWFKLLPYLGSARTIQRLVLSLERDGLLITGNFNSKSSDRSKWYRVDHNALEDYCNNAIADKHKYIVPNWHDDHDKVASSSRQNGTMTMPKVDDLLYIKDLDTDKSKDFIFSEALPGKEKLLPQVQGVPLSSSGKVDRESTSPVTIDSSSSHSGKGVTRRSGTPSPYPLPQPDATQSQIESVKEQHPWRNGRSVDPKFALFIGKQLPKGKNDGSMNSQTKGRKYILNSEASELGLDKLWGDWEDYQAVLEAERSKADTESSGLRRFDRKTWNPKMGEKVVFIDTDYIFYVKAMIDRDGLKLVSDVSSAENLALEEQGKKTRWFKVGECIPYY